LDLLLPPGIGKAVLSSQINDDLDAVTVFLRFFFDLIPDIRLSSPESGAPCGFLGQNHIVKLAEVFQDHIHALAEKLLFLQLVSLILFAGGNPAQEGAVPCDAHSLEFMWKNGITITLFLKNTFVFIAEMLQ